MLDNIIGMLIDEAESKGLNEIDNLESVKNFDKTISLVKKISPEIASELEEIYNQSLFEVSRINFSNGFKCCIKLKNEIENI